MEVLMVIGLGDYLGGRRFLVVVWELLLCIYKSKVELQF
jgi:hypothetical protein